MIYARTNYLRLRYYCAIPIFLITFSARMVALDFPTVQCNTTRWYWNSSVQHTTARWNYLYSTRPLGDAEVRIFLISTPPQFDKWVN